MTTTASASELGWHRCDDDPDRRWVHLASVERAGVAPGSIPDFDHPPDEEPLLAWTRCFVCAYAERLEEIERAVVENAEAVGAAAASIATSSTGTARARADEAWRARPAEPSTAERPTSLTLPCGSERGSDLLLVLGTAAEVTTAARGAAEDAVDALAAVLRLARRATATAVGTTRSPPPPPPTTETPEATETTETEVVDPYLARLAAVAALVRREVDSDSGSGSSSTARSSPEPPPPHATGSSRETGGGVAEPTDDQIRRTLAEADARLVERFILYHRANPHVFVKFVDQARRIKDSGRQKYSAWTIITWCRFEHDLVTTGDVFKINNDFIALYARLLPVVRPEFVGFFDMRAMLSSGRRSSQEEHDRRADADTDTTTYDATDSSMLRVYTSRVGCRDPDALDVTRKSAGPAGLPFAPSWALLRRALPKLAKGAPVVTPEQYEVEYRAEMAASRARDPGTWEAMLARPRVVLLCYCASPDRCHRRLLARMLVELGGIGFVQDRGELSAAGREVAEPAVEPAEPSEPDDEPPPPTGQVTLF
jgi:hypothetical protein